MRSAFAYAPGMSLRGFRLLAVLWLTFSGPVPASADADEWTPGDSASGAGYAYQSFWKKSEGESFVRFRLRGTIEARVEALLEAAAILSSDPAWVQDGQTRTVLESTPDSFVVHTRVDFPALLSDRDIVSRGARSEPDGDTQKFEWTTTTHESAPPIDGVVRIEKAAGSWEFTPQDATTAGVVYETYADLDVPIPNWLIVPMMAGTLGENFEDLAEIARARGGDPVESTTRH